MTTSQLIKSLLKYEFSLSNIHQEFINYVNDNGILRTIKLLPLKHYMPHFSGCENIKTLVKKAELLIYCCYGSRQTGEDYFEEYLKEYAVFHWGELVVYEHGI